ncbi:MAG: hypothetical protein M1817_002251 [Caeruleum heppii]|nr:MAG: hypothetical protein M1817_002251 [Caeruleum heppii]
MTSPENVDLAVIGAGWHGLAAAKTYLEVNPTAKVIVLEAAPTIGGVWAEHRLYPGLKSNNMLGTYEYSDFPMDEATFGVRPGQHIPGQVIHEYLRSYAEHFDVYRRIRFRTKVESVEHQQAGGWRLNLRRSNDSDDGSEIDSDFDAGSDVDKPSIVITQKLIVATGLTSEPFLPEFAGHESFDAPVIHCRNLKRYSETLFKTATSVVILGGTKSAWDAAYAFASAGIKVEWVIRESGHGPIWMAPPYVTPLKKWLEMLVTTRFLTWFSPCIWGDADGYGGMRRFFHGTAVGRWIVDRFWWVLANDVTTLNGYDKHPETKKLKPWTGAFWVASSLSILNYPTDFFDYVRNGNIKVHIGDISHLSSRAVHLSSGVVIQTDALVCSTGWKHKPPITFLPEGGDEDLGLPYYSVEPEGALVRDANEQILRQFPRLKRQPEINPKFQSLPGSGDVASSQNRPWRLFRFMVPPAYVESRSIGYAGMLQTINTSLCAQTQALWLTAYLGGKLPLDLSTPEKSGEGPMSLRDRIKWETVLHSQFGKWRYPAGFGKKYPDFVFDSVPYLDMLLKDLGLQSHRKKGAMAEMFEPYGPSDYRGLVDEWRIKIKQ